MRKSLHLFMLSCVALAPAHAFAEIKYNLIRVPHSPKEQMISTENVVPQRSEAEREAMKNLNLVRIQSKATETAFAESAPVQSVSVKVLSDKSPPQQKVVFSW